jgi:hypothetical protein
MLQFGCEMITYGPITPVNETVGVSHALEVYFRRCLVSFGVQGILYRVPALPHHPVTRIH